MDAEIGARVRARMKEALPGASQVEVSAKLGLAPDAFSRSLNGKRAFTAVELVQLGHLLGTSAHWFVTGEPDPFAVKYAGRHTFDRDLREHLPIDWTVTSTRLDDIALAYVQAYGRSDRAEPGPSGVTATDARRALVEVGGEDFVRHLADHVESAFGVDVVRISELEADFALEILGRRVIVIHETGNWFRENFGIAHELAHVLADELSELGNGVCDEASAEKRANAFAAELLLPSAALTAVDWSSASGQEVAELVWRSGVSTEALATRLSSLGIEPGDAAAAALDMRTQSLLRREHVPRAEVDLITERMRDAATRRFPAHLIAAHRVGVAEGRLRPDTLAWMLGVDVESIEEELAPPSAEADVEWLARELGLAD